jgi:hypothetical protein
MSDSNGTTSNDTPAPAPKALTVKPSMGAAASLIDPAELDAAVTERRQALEALATDPTLPEATRKSLLALVALASPNKPGMEEVSSAWKVARINIAQPTTRSEAKPDSARPGDLYTTAGQQLEKPWAGIPLYFFEENINFPDGGKNPVCQAPDGKLGSPFGKCLDCPHLPFGKQNGGRGDQKKTDCQSNIVCVMLAKDMSQVYLVQFGKTSRKAGSALLSLAGQQAHVWKQSYILNTEKKTNDVGLYYIYKVEPTGKDNPEDVCRVAEALYGLFGAERKKFLADWYARPARAPMAAVEAEGEFAAGALEAGLGGTSDEEPTDLNEPAKPASASGSARNATKPM